MAEAIWDVRDLATIRNIFKVKYHNTVTVLVGPPTIQSRVGLYPPVRRVSNRINQDVVMLRSKARSQVLPRSLYQRILYFSNSYTPCDVNTSNEYTYKSFL